MVVAPGLEPGTFPMWTERSNQLSYATIWLITSKAKHFTTHCTITLANKQIKDHLNILSFYQNMFNLLGDKMIGW